MSNTGLEYTICCLCTEGQGTIFGNTFSVRVPLSRNCFELLEYLVNKVRSAYPDAGWPISALDPGYNLWKLLKPLSLEDMETELTVREATTLLNVSSDTESHKRLVGQAKLSTYFTSDQLETYDEHVHLVLQVPKSKKGGESKLWIISVYAQAMLTLDR